MMTGTMIELHPGGCRHGVAPACRMGAGGRERVPALGGPAEDRRTEGHVAGGRLAEGQCRFVVQASHELRTPLAALRLELEEALTHRDAADPYAALEQALHSTERLENTVIALLGLLQGDPCDQTGS
jgi:signal transduction histidine kinase